MDYLTGFIKELVWILTEMSPYLLLGFVFAGIMHVLIPGKSIIRYLGGNNFTSVLNASLLGIPLPLCSCGVIPTGLSFYKHGASKASTVSFLISTPQTGVDSVMVTWSLLGLPFALIRPVVAFATGLFGGFLTKKIAGNSDSKLPLQEINDIEPGKGFWPLVKELFRYPFVEFMQDISKWLVTGLLIAALISVAVPNNFFADKIPGSFAGMLMMLLVAIPVYICATASVPVAAVLIMKGLSPGAALVLLMAGPATNAATITMIARTMGTKTLVLYLSSIIAGALAAGSVIDYLLPSEWFLLPSGAVHAGHAHDILPIWLKISSAVILTIFIINALITRYFKNLRIRHKETVAQTENNISYLTLNVEGMTCNHCRQTVENAVKAVRGVSEAVADHSKGIVEIKGSGFDTGEIISNIEKSGYRIVKKL